MKTKTLFLFLFIFTYSFLYGQKTIKGQVLNKDNSPSEYVAVTITTKGDLSHSVQTDSLGLYSLTINDPAEYYVLTLSSWGIKLYQDSIPDFNIPTIIKNITLNDSVSIGLNEIVVSGQRNTLKLQNDKFVFAPDISLLKSNSAFDVLKHMPILKVDDNDISLIYKSGANVFLNNRPLRMPLSSLIEYLKSMPSDNIKNIEVITNPGSNQEASITGGIINIVLRKNIDDGYNAQIRLSDEQSQVNRQIASGSFQFHRGNFGLQGGLSALNYPAKYKDKTEIITKEGLIQDINSRIKSDYKGLNFNLDAEYILNENHVFNLFSSIRHNKPNINTNSFTSFGNTSNNQTDSITNTRNKDKGNKINNYFFNSSYQYLINDKGHNLNVSFDYMDYSESQHRYTQNYTVDNEADIEIGNHKTSAPQDIKTISAKTDYTLPFDKNTLNAGLLYSSNESENVFQWQEWNGTDYVLDADQSNKFSYKEKISAAYISLSRQWSDKFYTSIGGRAEYTETKSKLTEEETESWSKDYFRFYPSASISLQPDQIWRINYSVSGKIQRPAFWQLNPVRHYSNQYLYTANNPALESVRLYTQSLAVSLKNKYTLAAEYTFKKDDIGQFLMPSPDKEYVNYYGLFNYGDRSSLYVSFISSFSFFNGFWRTNVSAGFQYDHYKMRDSDIKRFYESQSSFNGIFRVSNTFRLSEKHNFWGYLNFRYYSPNVYLTQRNISYPVFNIEFRKSWSEWTLTLEGNDIFDGGKSISKMASDQKLSPYVKNKYTVYPDTRSVLLRISYAFGNSKTKRNNASKIANDEIYGRIK